MAEFRYTALDGGGHEVTGSLQAENRAAAMARLKSQGMFPMGVEVAGGAAAMTAPAGAVSASKPASGGFALFPKKVPPAELALFTRQLASLFNAGLNMARSLDTLIEHAENATLRQALEEVKQSVSGGSTLWESLAEHPRLFNDLYVNLVRAGEASGQLGDVLARLADSLEIQLERSSKVKSALSYPILLLSAGFGAVLFILVFLVPRFAAMFKSLNRPLPAPTLFLINLQGFITQYGWLLAILIVGTIFAVRSWSETEAGGLAMDRFRMKLPIVGSIIHKEAISLFCRTMSTLVKGGVPILTSFEVAERAVGNRVLRQAIESVRNAVRGGEPLAGPLKRSGVFPGLVTNMIAVGEETGNLDEMLARVADAYDAEIANKLRQLVALVEPAVILLMGGIIGTIVLSMLLPVVELTTGVGG